MVQIGFEETLYTVREGDGTVEVNVAVLSGGLSSNVVVTLVTQDAEAAGKLHSKITVFGVCVHACVCLSNILVSSHNMHVQNM